MSFDFFMAPVRTEESQIYTGTPPAVPAAPVTTQAGYGFRKLKRLKSRHDLLLKLKVMLELEKP